MVLLSHSRLFSLCRRCTKLVIGLLAILFLVSLLLQQDEKSDVRQKDAPIEDLSDSIAWEPYMKDRNRKLANEKANGNERLIFEKLDELYEARLRSPEENERIRWSSPQQLIPNCAPGQLEDGKCPFVKEDRFPMIVWWTPFTFYKHIIRRCSVGRCTFTHNRREHENSRTRAFLFYGSSIERTDWPLPRSKNHEWVLLHEESPKNVYMFNHGDALAVFNLTSTFRRESDFPLTLQWLRSVEDLLDTRYFVPTAEKNAAIVREGIAPVAYIQSDCGCPSDRDNFVRELMRHIRVDALGICLHNRDLPHSVRDSMQFEEEVFLRVASKYKFTIAMENAVCPDYITEKLWRPLKLGSVPIYFGSPSIRDWLPNRRSAILVNDFASAKELAGFLTKLNQDDAQYEEYLGLKLGTADITNNRLKETLAARTWHHDNPELQTFVDAFECFVCDKVYETLLQKANGHEQQRRVATVDHYGCPEPKMFSGILPEDTLSRNFWGREWREAKLEAQALFNMVQHRATDGHLYSKYLYEVRNQLKKNDPDTV